MPEASLASGGHPGKNVGYRHPKHDILVLPQDLQDFAWSAPMRDLAAQLGLSDVGLRKIFKGHGIVLPKQGYWNRVKAGKQVPVTPAARARRPGETGRLRVDQRFASMLSAVEPLPSSGPFASTEVPEDLHELYDRVLMAIGRVSVPRNPDRYHPGLARLVKSEERRRAKVAASQWAWDAPRFDGPLAQRKLRILNAIFLALDRQGHGGSAGERDGEIEASAVIGDTRVDLKLEIVGRHNTIREHGRDRASPDLPASTPLALVIDVDPDGEPRSRWEDGQSGRLEARLAPIIASIITVGEDRFRRGLKHSEEWAAQTRRWEEERRQAAIVARNAERLGHLRESGDLLRRADDLRALIARVHHAAVAGGIAVDRGRLAEWENWASAEADRIDPLLSGQIMTHLAPTREEGT